MARYRSQPNNLLSVLLGSAGQAIQGIPEFQQNQQQIQQRNLFQMLGLQQDQRKQDITEAYRKAMTEAEQQRIAIAEQNARRAEEDTAYQRQRDEEASAYQKQQDALKMALEYAKLQSKATPNNSKPPAVPPNIVGDVRKETRSRNEDVREWNDKAERGVVSQTRPEVNPVDVYKEQYQGIMPFLQQSYPQAFGPNAQDSIMTLLQGGQYPPPKNDFLEFNNLGELEQWYNSPASKSNPNREKIYKNAKAALQ